MTDVDPSERHDRTGALKTNTPETATPGKVPTTAEILARQNAEPSAPLPSPPKEAIQLPARAAPAQALEHNLARLTSTTALAILIGFNGQTGVYRILSDDTEIPLDSEYQGHLEYTRHEMIKFNGEGNPPSIVGYCISEDGILPERDTLGDLDKSQWPFGLDGTNRVDPWRERYLFPMKGRDAGGELYGLVMMGPVALNAATKLLPSWRYHPNRKLGYAPIICLGRGTWIDKKHGGAKRPKPYPHIVDWVNADGSPITAQQKHGEFRDVVPF
jgi:hypothetical protein